MKNLSTADIQQAAFGQLGMDYIDDTAAHTGLDLVAITMCSDTTFTALTCTGVRINGVESTNLAKTFLKGITIYGRFTAVQLGTGSIAGYRAN